MSESINIVIRLMPSGDELDVELPVFTTGRELVSNLLSENLAPRTDPEGNPYIYELISKVNNVRLDDEKTLYDAGIKDGTTLYFVPKLVAGGDSIFDPQKSWIPCPYQSNRCMILKTPVSGGYLNTFVWPRNILTWPIWKAT